MLSPEDSKKYARARQLFETIGKAKTELRELGIARTDNIESDFTEWFTCKTLNLNWEPKPDYDAQDEFHKKYQIKGRGCADSISAGFDNFKLDEQGQPRFDYLVCVFFEPINHRFTKIYLVDKNVVSKHTEKFEKRNSFRWNKQTKQDNGIKQVWEDVIQ